jgi:hypothetical protein
MRWEYFLSVRRPTQAAGSPIPVTTLPSLWHAGERAPLSIVRGHDATLDALPGRIGRRSEEQLAEPTRARSRVLSAPIDRGMSVQAGDKAGAAEQQAIADQAIEPSVPLFDRIFKRMSF